MAGLAGLAQRDTSATPRTPVAGYVWELALNRAWVNVASTHRPAMTLSLTPPSTSTLRPPSLELQRSVHSR
jgi:hypothetical protein